jgi:hypothetical protein
VFRVQPPPDEVSVRLGDTIRIEGAHLDGTAVTVRFGHALLDGPIVVPIGANTSPGGVDVTLPTGPAAEAAWPAGVWTVRVSLVRPGEAVARETNVAAMVLAPVPVLAPPPTVNRDAGSGAVTVTLAVRPRVRPSQVATLALDGHVATADARTAATSTLIFHFGPVPDGSRFVRLSVDGAESRLVDRTKQPPVFDPSQKLVVPA